MANKGLDRGIIERRLKNGCIVYDVRLWHNGKPVLIGGFRSKSEARRIYRRAKVEQENGTFNPQTYQKRTQARQVMPAPTFKEYAENWLEERSRRYRPSTLEGHRWTLQSRAYPAFGEVPLSDITREMVKQLILDEFKRTTRGRQLIKARTVRKTYWIINKIFRSAYRDQWISSNHAEAFADLIAKPQKYFVDPLFQDEERRLLDAIQQQWPQWYPLFFTLLRTGLRIGEALALEPRHIHFAEEFITVEQSWTLLGELQETTKTGKARRVDLSRKLAGVLRDHLARLKQRAENRWEAPPQWLFPGLRGEPLTQQYVRRVLQAMLAAIGLRRIRVHDLRHTFATLLLFKGDRRGVTLKYVSQQLGHSSIATTADIYLHLAPGEHAGAINALDEDPVPEGLCPTCRQHLPPTDTSTAIQPAA